MTQFLIAALLFFSVTLIVFRAPISRAFYGIGLSIAWWRVEEIERKRQRQAKRTAHIDCARAALRAAAPKPTSMDVVV